MFSRDAENASKNTYMVVSGQESTPTLTIYRVQIQPAAPTKNTGKK
jgi:hypothetical protein